MPYYSLPVTFRDDVTDCILLLIFEYYVITRSIVVLLAEIFVFYDQKSSSVSLVTLVVLLCKIMKSINQIDEMQEICITLVYSCN